MESLVVWNFGAALLHLVAAILSLRLLNNKSNRIVQMSRLKFDEERVATSRIDVPVTLEDEAQIDLKFIVVFFFAFTSFSHFLYATDFVGLGWYSSQILQRGWNPFRWVEYSISAGAMVYLISIASGTKDQVSAITSALIVPSLMVSGFTTERELNQNALHDWSVQPMTMKKPEIDSYILWSNLIPAWFLFATNWYIILSNYSKLSKEAKEAGKPLDASAEFMVYSQLGFFSLFGVIQTYQVYRYFVSKSGKIEPNFIVYEKAYIILSAVTKLLLALTVGYAMRN
jgi:hypothetical protein